MGTFHTEKCVPLLQALGINTLVYNLQLSERKKPVRMGTECNLFLHDNIAALPNVITCKMGQLMWDLLDFFGALVD